MQFDWFAMAPEQEQLNPQANDEGLVNTEGVSTDFPKVKTLLDRGADPNARSHEYLDRTALIMAAEMPQRGFHPDEDRNIFLAVQMGSELGLAITRHLVELHGGTVEARSEGKNRGSVFLVRLPIRRDA